MKLKNDDQESSTIDPPQRLVYPFSTGLSMNPHKQMPAKRERRKSPPQQEGGGADTRPPRSEVCFICIFFFIMMYIYQIISFIMMCIYQINSTRSVNETYL
jgi:hypothetical protein